MTTDTPLSTELPSGIPADACMSEAEVCERPPEVKQSSREKLERGRRHHAQKGGKSGIFTGTREGVICTGIAIAGSLLFGGAAGDWFAPTELGWVSQMLTISGGTMMMAALVCLAGSLLTRRNPIFWGIGMPLLVYAAGSFCSFVSGHAGASTFLFGAPVFCGLSILSGVMCAYVVDRE